MSVKFRFSEVREEIRAMSEIADGFIAPGSKLVLDRLAISLDNIRASRGAALENWGIPADAPLVTVPSEGGYEPGGGGGHVVFAELSSTWEIRCIPALKKSREPDYFAVEGIASTRVRVCTEDSGERRELAMWRMEMGDENSPGCHFHVQILGETDDVPFPHSLSIPRLPSIVLTPASVLEFVLGEMFQDEWKQEAARETGAMNRWRPIQTRRLRALFEWYAAKVESSFGSPWTFLKGVKPIEGELF